MGYFALVSKHPRQFFPGNTRHRSDRVAEYQHQDLGLAIPTQPIFRDFLARLQPKPERRKPQLASQHSGRRE